MQIVYVICHKKMHMYSTVPTWSIWEMDLLSPTSTWYCYSNAPVILNYGTTLPRHLWSTSRKYINKQQFTCADTSKVVELRLLYDGCVGFMPLCFAIIIPSRGEIPDRSNLFIHLCQTFNTFSAVGNFSDRNAVFCLDFWCAMSPTTGESIKPSHHMKPYLVCRNLNGCKDVSIWSPSVAS